MRCLVVLPAEFEVLVAAVQEVLVCISKWQLVNPNSSSLNDYLCTARNIRSLACVHDGKMCFPICLTAMTGKRAGSKGVMSSSAGLRPQPSHQRNSTRSTAVSVEPSRLRCPIRFHWGPRVPFLEDSGWLPPRTSMPELTAQIHQLTLTTSEFPLVPLVSASVHIRSRPCAIGASEHAVRTSKRAKQVRVDAFVGFDRSLCPLQTVRVPNKATYRHR